MTCALPVRSLYRLLAVPDGAHRPQIPTLGVPPVLTRCPPDREGGTSYVPTTRTDTPSGSPDRGGRGLVCLQLNAKAAGSGIDRGCAACQPRTRAIRASGRRLTRREGR